uniref:FBA_2 domain-containing protein n=1 Tax=Caenorhabditis tropicalis TaxID=1561998 RepID=A0A1I7TU02_9PELO
MFPFLRLPFLCIQDVTDMWDIDELYHFSLLSKKAKRISKRRKENDLEVYLNMYFCVLTIRRNGEDVCRMVYKQKKFLFNREEIPSFDPDFSSFFQLTQHFLDVFNCCLQQIDFKLKRRLTENHLIEIINWLNNSKTEIRGVVIKGATWSMLELYMNRFRKTIRQLYFNDKKFKNEGGYICKSVNFGIKDSFLSLHNSPWFHLDCILNLNCEQISGNKLNFTAEDLNVFLRSWQEGKTNREAKQVVLSTSSPRDVKEVLKGCGGELMDPRTNKLKFRILRQNKYEDIWIRGGIYIRRNDGCLAVMQTNSYRPYTEDEDVSEEQVEVYLKYRDNWNSENSHDQLNETFFSFYIF